jgi:TPR repeat protein
MTLQFSPGKKPMPKLLTSLLLLALTSLLSAQEPSGRIDAAALFEKGMNGILGSGYSRTDLTALEYFRNSADLGYAPAQVVMGYFAETGLLRPQDFHEAVTWYAKAAKQDDPLAEWVLGRCYFTGDGELRDLSEAEKLLQKAANAGSPFGMYLLGEVKLQRQDYVSAVKWFRPASEQGLPQAQKQLGLLLKQGRGVPEDKPQAYMWLLLSFEAGNKSVGDDVKQLEAELGSNLIEQLKTKARHLQDTASRSVAAHGCTGWPGEFDDIPTTPPPDLQRFCR